MTELESTVLIGVGNRDRGDDAAGPLVCDAVCDLGGDSAVEGGRRVVVLESSVVDLLTHWTADDRVVIVDAAQPAGRPGHVAEYDCLAGELPVPPNLSTHDIDVTGGIELARVLDRLPAALTVVAIEGASFELGRPLSPSVARSVREVAARLSRRGT